MKKRITSCVLAMGLCIASSAGAAGFIDVDGGMWYKEYIDRASESGIINGYEDGAFAPDKNTTRAEFVMMLWNMAKNPEAYRSNDFSDVKGDDWYYNAVNWAAEEGIVSGYPDNSFRPNDNITREQLALMLKRYSGDEPEYDMSYGDRFKDISDTGDYARPAVIWAVRTNLLKGVSADMLMPKAYATRAMIAAVLVRFSQTEQDNKGADKFLGSRQDEVSQRASLDITKEGENKYKALVSWGNGAFSTVVWAMECVYDGKKDMLVYENGVKEIITFTDEQDNSEVVWEDGTGSFYIKDGYIFWNDDKECRFLQDAFSKPLPPDGADAYEGNWYDKNSQRAMLEIAPVSAGKLNAVVSWGVSAFQKAIWEMECEYDADENVLKYSNGKHYIRTYSSEEEYTDEAVWEGSSGKFYIKERDIYWEDDKEEEASGRDFEKYEKPQYKEAPSKESIKEIFDTIIGLEEGTAGASLKEAQAAAKTLDFAVSENVIYADPEKVGANLLSVYNTITDEDKLVLNENLPVIAELINYIFDDYNYVKGLYEDAGVKELVDALIESPDAEYAWDTLIKIYKDNIAE